MRTPIGLLAAMALLAACSTAEQRAAYDADPAIAMAPQYGPGCEKVGYAKGSEQWRACILKSSKRDDLGRWGQFWDRYPQQQTWNLTR